MEINIKRITFFDLMDKAAAFTLHNFKQLKVDKDKMYAAEHSPIRTQLFWIEMYDIPSFVSTHFVRHKIGVEHFVSTNRDDRGGTGIEDRNTPVNHAMLINAQALINMARKRLCYKAHPLTVKVMQEIKRLIYKQDSYLYYYLVPECEYRKGCHEFKTCGYYKRSKVTHKCSCTGSSSTSMCDMHKKV